MKDALADIAILTTCVAGPLALIFAAVYAAATGDYADWQYPWR